jgi:hypothetical protein
VEKLSADRVVAVLAEVPETLTKLASDRDHWMQRAVQAEAKLNEFEQASRLSKIASSIEQKNLEPGRSREEIIGMLQKKASEGRIDAVEEAIEMSVGHRPLGTLSDVPGGGASQLENYLVGELS